jgi:hypothetical protein
VNIVKLQNDLKDLSDQQLLSSMQMGSAPQYLVLAEMQRRKKMRDETSSQPQAQSTVADEIMGGITQLPMQAQQMASGGLVSFAAGGSTSDAYKQGTGAACWKNPVTGETDCPPGSAKMLEAPSSHYAAAKRVKKAEGGIVSLQGGGTPSEARAMLAAKGVDTTGMSDDEVMNIAATYAGVMAPNVDVAEPTPDTGFSPVPATQAPLPPAPMAEPEPAPKAEPSFMDTITSGITSLLGMGEVQAAEPVPAGDKMTAGEARNWLKDNAADGYDPSKRSDAQVLEDIKSYQPGGAQFERKKADEANAAAIQARGDTYVTSRDLWNISEPTKEEAEARAATQPRQPAFSGAPEVKQFQEETTQAQTQEEREAAARKFTESKRAEQERARAEAEAAKSYHPGSSEGARVAAEADAAARQRALDTITNQYRDEDVKAEGRAAGDPLLQYLNELRAERGEDKNSAMSDFLMAMGLNMMASDNPNFWGAAGEGGVAGLKSMAEGRKAEAERKKDIRKQMTDVLGSRETALYRHATAASSRADTLRKAINDLQSAKADNPADAAGNKYRDQMIQQYTAELNRLLDVQGGTGMMTAPPLYEGITFK